MLPAPVPKTVNVPAVKWPLEPLNILPQSPQALPALLPAPARLLLPSPSLPETYAPGPLRPILSSPVTPPTLPPPRPGMVHQSGRLHLPVTSPR